MNSKLQYCNQGSYIAASLVINFMSHSPAESRPLQFCLLCALHFGFGSQTLNPCAATVLNTASPFFHATNLEWK
jgi:hypothetical protein